MKIPGAQDIFKSIMHAADRQMNTSDFVKTMDDKTKAQLKELIEQIASNAANPIALDIEDAVSAAA